MTKLVIKSLIFGFIVGIIFFAIAPLALGIAFIEFLRPLLVPGVDLFKSFWQTTGLIPTSQWIFAIALNGFIYSILFFAVLFSNKNILDKKTKFLVIGLIIIIFLAATGMLTNFYSFLTSPNKSWILEIGA